MNLAEYIMSKKDGANANTAQLQIVGKEAARALLDNGTPLDDTVRSMSKESGLNFEQITRAAEFANNETFIRRFAQPYDRNIAYPLADARSIAASIHADLLPVEKTASRQVRTTDAYRPGWENLSERDLFGGAVPSRMVKEASLDRNAVARKALVAKETLRNTQAETEYIEAQFLTKIAQLNRAVYQETASGTEPWMVGAAVVHARPSTALFGVIASELGRSMETAQLVKMAAAGFEVEEENPITSLVQDLENITQKLQANEEITQRTKATIEELLNLLRGPEDVNATEQLFSEDRQQAAQQMGQQLGQQLGGAPAPPPPGAPTPGQPMPGQPMPGQPA